MAISFPLNPNNGDTYSYGGKVYVYNSTTTLWTIQSSTSVVGLTADSISENLVPSANVTYDLGTTDKRWRDLYLSGNTLHLGTTSLSVTSEGSLQTTVGGEAVEIGGSAITSYANTDTLPFNGNEIGDQAFITSTNTLYLWNGNGWYKIALINLTPTITSNLESSYGLSKTGVATELTLTAEDPEGIPITWSYEVTSGTLGNTAVITQSNNVFTITPSTNANDAGLFTVTFKASDGVNFASESASFSLSFNAQLDILIVAGGGGGGGSPHGGGGGAGGLVLVEDVVVPSGLEYTIVVGQGGAGYLGKNASPWPSAGTNKGDNGTNSVAFGITALGGGGGGGYSGGGGSDTPGQDGGSGGGGTDESGAGSALQASSGYSVTSAVTDGTYTGYGNAGGTSTDNSYSKGGGGAGERGDIDGNGTGGDGIDLSTYFGTSVGDSGWFSGGGGGAEYSSTARVPVGGQGGGGQGGSNSREPRKAGSGVDGTGGGGGGAERSSDALGGDGGDGIVLVKVKPASSVADATTGSPTTVTAPDGATVYVFSANGSITF